jgi:hypothetical protein
MGILIDTLSIARETMNSHESAARSVRAQIETTEKALAAATRKNSTNRMAGLTRDLENHKSVLASVEAAYKDAKARVVDAEKALEAAREPRFAAREQEIRDYLDIAPDGDVLLKARRSGGFGLYSRTDYEVMLLEIGADLMRVMKSYERDGETFSYPEERFGYHADVSAPHKDYRGNWEFSKVNWPSIGAQNATNAQDFIRVLTLGTTLADFLNVKCYTWDAEDLAD